MKIRPYLTYQGNCKEAIDLYEKAFKTSVDKIMYFKDIPNSPVELENLVLQATLPIGEDFIRMSDCPSKLNDPESERISLAVETDIETVKYAFNILAVDGRIGISLEETHYSPLAGVVFDKFGVMWNFISQK